MSRISIIMPCLNEAAQIGDTLAALQPLRQQGLQLILVDGGSSDGTRQRAAGLVDRLEQSAPGRARQMNHGARLADGDILWFLHADTLAPVSAPQAILQASAEGRAWGRFDIRLSGATWPFRVIERAINLRSRLSGIATGDQGIFVGRALFDRVGGFPDLPLMEDLALSDALKACARPACLRPQLLTSSRRWEHRGILRTLLLMWRLRALYRLGVPARILARSYD
jgi:rSAM/selenodomain-associated transferase 2